MSDVPCSFLLPLSDEMEQHQSPQSSALSSSENDFKEICRICHSEGKADSPLISPCYCSGSLCYIHNSCLQKWIKSSGTKCCEICKFQFIMETKFLPFWKWKKLKMPFVEKLLLVLSFTFHAMMIPSLACVLVMMVGKEADEQRLLLTNERIITCTLEIIILIGLLIEIVFMVKQCKLCVQLFRKWRNCNRVIYVQNAPKIGRTLQQQQQRAVEFSASPQLSTNELTSEDTNFLSPINSNTYNSDGSFVKFSDEKNTSGEITKTKTNSTKTSLTSDYDLLLSEVVVISTVSDDISRKDNSKTTADEIQVTENDTQKTSLIGRTDDALIPVAKHKCPMNEFVETSTAIEPTKGNLKKNVCHFFSGSHSRKLVEDKDFLLAQKGHS